jgi:hypothetical protein
VYNFFFLNCIVLSLQSRRESPKLSVGKSSLDLVLLWVLKSVSFAVIAACMCIKARRNDDGSSHTGAINLFLYYIFSLKVIATSCLGLFTIYGHIYHCKKRPYQIWMNKFVGFCN